MILQAYDLVGFLAHRGEALGGRHWHGEYKLLRVSHAGRTQGHPGGCSRRDTIIDHNGRSARNAFAFATAQIPLPPPLDFDEFVIANRLEFGLVDASEPRAMREPG